MAVLVYFGNYYYCFVMIIVLSLRHDVATKNKWKSKFILSCSLSQRWWYTCHTCSKCAEHEWQVSIPELLLVFVLWCWWSSFLLLVCCCCFVLLCYDWCRCTLCSVIGVCRMMLVIVFSVVVLLLFCVVVLWSMQVHAVQCFYMHAVERYHGP